MSECAWLQEGSLQHRLEGSSWVLGRQVPAEVVFALPQISRQHARVDWREGRYFLSDLGSRFGTYCQGQPVGAEPVRLRDGDEVVLGGVLSLRFHDPAETREGRRLGRLEGVWLNEETQVVWVDAVEVDLPPSQVELVRALLAREGEFLTREELGPGLSEDALDGLIKRLRARFREVTATEYLETRRGRGLRLRPPGQ